MSIVVKRQSGLQSKLTGLSIHFVLINARWSFIGVKTIVKHAKRGLLGTESTVRTILHSGLKFNVKYVGPRLNVSRLKSKREIIVQRNVIIKEEFMMNNKCLNCKKSTNNPKFCSRSCSAVVNNRKHPKRIAKTYYCQACNIKIELRKKYCDEHNPFIVDWSDITYKDLSNRYNYQKNSRVRSLARQLYRGSDKPKCCSKCGYDKHIEICHIKPIYSFDENVKISEINDISNLIALCRNCHWEFDNDTSFQLPKN